MFFWFLFAVYGCVCACNVYGEQHPVEVILLASTASAHQRDLSSQWRKALMILEMGEDRSIQLNTFLLLAAKTSPAQRPHQQY